MTTRRIRTLSRFRADASAVVRSNERAILLFLLLLSLVALAVFLHYTTFVLEGLPDVIPSEPPRPRSSAAAVIPCRDRDPLPRP